MLSLPTPPFPTDALAGAALALHFVGLFAGMGAALTLDAIFTSALLDPRRGASRSRWVRRLAPWVWSGAALLVVSGGVLAALEPTLAGNSKFQAKMVVVAVLGINAALFHRRVAPRIDEVFFRVGATSLRSVAVPRLRRVAFTVGGISAASWLSAATLGFAPSDQPLGTAALLILYAGALGAAALAAQGCDRLYRRRLESLSRRETCDVAGRLLERVERGVTLFGVHVSQDRRRPPPPPGG